MAIWINTDVQGFFQDFAQGEAKYRIIAWWGGGGGQRPNLQWKPEIFKGGKPEPREGECFERNPGCLLCTRVEKPQLLQTFINKLRHARRRSYHIEQV